MNKTGFALGALSVIIIIAAIVLFLLPANTKAPTVTDTPVATTTPVATNPTLEDLLVVESLHNGDTIPSPLTITGKARGNWYFEASFPVQIKNASGTVIAQGPAQAQGDWMTSDFVPFSITLSFPAQPSGSTGTVVLHNDNPSGDPARDKQLSIPVVFQ